MPHKNKNIKAAFYYSMPFQLRVLEPIAEEFEETLLSNSINEIEEWMPNVLFTSDAAQIPNLRGFCDSNNVKLIGLRHGVANKYIPTDPQYALANYVCGSEWDKIDFESAKVFPKDKFLITGNPWIDGVFKISKRDLNTKNPTILFAPTYNPEVSAAVFLKDDLIDLIRSVYPESKIIIKPHPAIIDNDHHYVTQYKELFVSLIEKWKKNVSKDARVLLIEDSKVSISDYFAETDILISDGSSLIFEFMALNRPILLYTSDEKVKFWNHLYDNKSISNGRRNVGAEFKTKNEFVEVLKHAFKLHNEKHSQYQKQYSEEIFGEFNDGKSSKRVAEAVKNIFDCEHKNDLRLIAFYLPQYHPVPENDQAWGKGFTEWTNVVKAKPLFPSHYQPQLPTELGYYDLRLDEVRKEQIDLAKAYGLHGFCYYYYWFNGKQVLETPINKLLANKDLDFPFSICWANENWTRKWDGHNDDIIFNQQHNDKDDIDFIQSLFPFFADKRYIRVEGKLILLIYRTELFHDIKQTAIRWREEVQKAGLGELYLVRVESFEKDVIPETIGFDAAVEFAPDWSAIGNPRNLSGIVTEEHNDLSVYDYKVLMNNMLSRKQENYKLFRGVTPSWDNTARRGSKATMFVNSSPILYEKWLRETIKQTKVTFKEEEQFIFINAWNEWAEGNHLEPDIKYGRKFLEATKNALNSVEKDKKNSVQQRRICMKTMSEPSDKFEDINRAVDEIIDTIGNGNSLMAIMELAEVDELREKSNWSIKKSESTLLEAEKLIEEDKLDEGLEKLVSILRMEPKNIEALNDYALVMILMEDYDEALRILQHILKLNPNNGVAKDNYAYLLENNLVSKTNMNSLNEKSDYEKKIEQELRIYENQKVVHNLPPNHDIYTGKVLSPKLKEATNYDNFWDWCAGEIDSLTSNLSRKIYGISIGCGNGDSEIEILKRVKNKHLLEFVGIDINPTMVDRGKKLAKENNLDCLDFQVGDFNYLKLDRKYDFFFANHSLHHVVELENLFDTIAEHSTDEMVFMINDMVGRNGHVLWDGSKKVVDHIWNQLNPKYKFNAYTKQYDREVMNHDCSVEGFEGIRAEDILPELLKRFDFDVYLPFSLIVNRFIDRVYGHNFDLGNEVDLKIIHAIIDLDHKLLTDRALSATQALFKLKKKGMTKEPRLIYQTAEESVSLRTNILKKENSSLDLLEYRKTIDDLKVILKDDENNIEALNNLSTEYIIIGKYEEASTLVSKVLHLENNNRYGLRNYQHLKQVLGGSIKLKPIQQIVVEDEVEKINTMAQVAVDNSKLFEARRLINKSLLLDPNNAITQLIIEQIEIRKKMLHNTNEWDSKKCNDAITQAELLIGEEKLTEAENMLLSILDLEPENIFALNDFSVVKILQKEYLVAQEIIDFVLQLDPLNEIANGNCDYIAELSENLVTVEYGDGFYEKEKNWYWIDKMAHFNINNSKKEQKICFDITCSEEKNYNIFPFNVFIYVGDSGVYSMSFESSNQTIPVEFESIGSDFKIMIESDDAFIPSAQGIGTDNRRIAMRFSNLHTKNEDNAELEIVEADSSINSGYNAVSGSGYTLLGDAKYPEYSDALESFLKDPTIMIELNSKCNFYCNYCRSENSARQKSFMKPELFRHLLPQLKDMTTQPLRFHVDGEPTLHPQFLELALEANKAGHKISLATNGSNLKKEFLQIDMSPVINISCTAEELKQRSSINFTKYIAKIEQYIHDWNEVDNVQNISLKIYTSGLERANGNIIENKKTFASEFVSRLKFADTSNWEGNENYERFEYRKDAGNIFSLSFQPLTEGGLYPNLSGFGFGGKELSKDRGFCDSAWKTLSILSDGSVCFCCVDVTGETYYTKPEEIWSNTLKEIWLDHPRIKRLRKEFLSGKISLPICRQCLETSAHREQYIFKEIFHFEKNSLST